MRTGALARHPGGGRRRHRGMSVVEVLISLAIAAMLLTAAAAAYSASAAAVEANDQFFRASQAARVAVNQIVTEVRRCQSGVVDTSSLELITASGENRTYSYAPDQRALLVTIETATGPVTHKMASNVEALEFYTDGDTIAMMITVQVQRHSVTLNGSAMPRRSVTY
jgi:prepilin-type N-terminal cleavage/methylation domain-containing protein